TRWSTLGLRLPSGLRVATGGSLGGGGAAGGGSRCSLGGGGATEFSVLGSVLSDCLALVSGGFWATAGGAAVPGLRSKTAAIPPSNTGAKMAATMLPPMTAAAMLLRCPALLLLRSLTLPARPWCETGAALGTAPATNDPWQRLQRIFLPK